MSQENVVLPITLKASGVVTKFRFVTPAGAQVSALNTPSIGVSKYDAATGTNFAATVLGTARVEAGGAVNVGDSVGADTSGRAIVANGILIQGIALQAASAAGQLIEVFLMHQRERGSFRVVTAGAGGHTAGAFVAFDATTQSAAGAACLGIALATVAAGQPSVVQLSGVGQALAGTGGLALGGPVKSAADGSAIAQGGTGVIAAYALAAITAGQLGPVLIK
ncbi:MAG: DUF2190 family protein [Sphingomonadaceae bacterium]|nr:DUF2190 family protein [Sphingomonadaceae bacterium]